VQIGVVYQRVPMMAAASAVASDPGSRVCVCACVCVCVCVVCVVFVCAADQCVCVCVVARMHSQAVAPVANCDHEACTDAPCPQVSV